MADLHESQIKVFKSSFDLFDKDKKGYINQADLRAVLKSLGQNPTEADLFDMIKAVDENNDGTIDFEEFKIMMSSKMSDETKQDDTKANLIIIEQDKLDENLSYRFDYMKDFMGLTDADFKLIHASNKVIGPKLDDIVAACFKKLWSFNVTKQVFYKGQATGGSLASYDLSKSTIGAEKWQLMSDQLVVQRRLTLKKFMERLLEKPYDAAMLEEMDRLGKIHSTKNQMIQAPLLHVNVMLGFLQDEILAALFFHKASYYESFNAPAAARAFAKIFTVVGDYISKHYV